MTAITLADVERAMVMVAYGMGGVQRWRRNT